MHLSIEDRDGAATLRVHGGRLDVAEQLYPFAPRPWIDLSTGINPTAYPAAQVRTVLLQRLPLARELAELIAAAGDTYGLPAGAAIVAVPGSEIAIRLLPLVTGCRRVGLVGPTYGSHGAAWRGAGAEVTNLAALPDPDSEAFDAVVVVNPNNPDGRAIARDELAAFAAVWTARGRRLIVDEAFADVRPDLSLLGLPAWPAGVVVLRSLGKFFGLAGLRVGFVVTEQRGAAAWHRLLGDWSVSGPACASATQALRDQLWSAAMRASLAADRRRLEQLLAGAQLRTLGGTDLFVLVETAGDVDLLDHFACEAILIRGFADNRRRYRFGLPGDAAGWQRLAAACSGLTG